MSNINIYEKIYEKLEGKFNSIFRDLIININNEKEEEPYYAEKKERFIKFVI